MDIDDRQKVNRSDLVDFLFVHIQLSIQQTQCKPYADLQSNLNSSLLFGILYPRLPE